MIIVVVLNGSGFGFPELALPAFTLCFVLRYKFFAITSRHRFFIVIAVISVKLVFTLLLT